jgi:serine/threonine protein kinase
MKGIFNGLRHIHSNDYVHRDLKPNNIVVADPKNLETVKILDFGLAEKFLNLERLNETCGTLVYQAPE